jgi:uncharacterized sulfatase
MSHYCRADMRAYRTERWKLVRDFPDPKRDEFYDLKNDPSESTNLIRSKSMKIQNAVDQLHEKLVAQMRAIGDPLAP